MTATAHSTITKRIRFNAAFEEYDMELDGEYIGSRKTYEEAETDLDAAAYEQSRILSAQIADEQAERDADTCEVCTSEPATVTVRSQGGVVRVCRPCFDAGWDQNEHAGGSWEADIDECALTPAEAHRADVMRQRDMLDVDLQDLRAAVDESVTVGVLAALVSSGCYLHSRQLLISDPASPDWATAEAFAAFIGRAA